VTGTHQPIPFTAIPPLHNREARTLVSVEVDRTIELLTGLRDADWRRPTPCDRWDVRAVLAHLVGEANDWAGPTTIIRMLDGGHRLARAEHLTLAEGMTEWQVARRSALTTQQLLDGLSPATRRLGRVGRAVMGPLRLLPFPTPGIGVVPLRFLTDELYLRDIWVHRADLADALERPLVLTQDHDARIVSLIAREWARRHRQPIQLELTGDAGATYQQGPRGDTLTIDAATFVRVLSGRARDGHPLMATSVRF
jgi:uncharacterized protein (TIGR03083 family)